MARKLHVDDCSRKPKFSFSGANYSLKLHKKHSIRLQHMESDDFTRHHIIRYLSARELVLPSCVNSVTLRPHPAHVRRRGLVSQAQILGLVEVLKPCNCRCKFALLITMSGAMHGGS